MIRDSSGEIHVRVLLKNKVSQKRLTGTLCFRTPALTHHTLKQHVFKHHVRQTCVMKHRVFKHRVRFLLHAICLWLHSFLDKARVQTGTQGVCVFMASVFKHRVFIHPVFKHRVFKHVSREVAVSRTTHIVPSYRILSCQVASFLCRCLRLCVDVLFRAVVASSPTRLSHSHGYGRYRGRGCFGGCRSCFCILC